jgi:hypothetical protein
MSRDGAVRRFVAATRSVALMQSRCMAVVGLLLGGLAVVVIPPVSTYDAPGHYYRSELVSRGHFRPIRYSARELGGDVPVRDSRFVNTLWTSYWALNHFGTFSEWATLARREPGDNERTRQDLTNIAVYSPANYVPQGVAMALVRMTGGSPLWSSRAACGLNLLCYLTLVIFALQAIPRFQTGLLLIATTPLLFIQSATLSSDGINFAVPVCIFALVWKMRAQPERRGKLDLAVVTLLALWMALLKPTQIICLSILLFTPERYFRSRRGKALWVGAIYLAGAGLWLYWNRPYLDVNIAGWFNPAHPPISAQKAWLRQHPGDFLKALGTFFGRDLFRQWKNFYGGVVGWTSKRVESVLTMFSCVFLAVLGVEICRNVRRDRAWGGFSVSLGLGLLLFTALTLWLSYGVRDTIPYIPYLGGRYLSLVYTLAFAGWSELVGVNFLKDRHYTLAAGLVLNVASLGFILIPTAIRVAR